MPRWRISATRGKPGTRGRARENAAAGIRPSGYEVVSPPEPSLTSWRRTAHPWCIPGRSRPKSGKPLQTRLAWLYLDGDVWRGASPGRFGRSERPHGSDYGFGRSPEHLASGSIAGDSSSSWRRTRGRLV